MRSDMVPGLTRRFKQLSNSHNTHRVFQRSDDRTHAIRSL